MDAGGAERQLTQLVRGLAGRSFSMTVVTLYEGGELLSDLQGLEGVKVVSLQKKHRWHLLPVLWRFGRVLREAKPQLLHGYMGGSNELCLLAGRVLGGSPRARIVWGLRASKMDFVNDGGGRMGAWIFRLGARLSRLADLIIVNSRCGQEHHLKEGYSGKRMVVIPNGIDTDRWYSDREAGDKIRREWNIACGEKLIGLVARLDPIKDHPTFLQAAALLARKCQDVKFVCVGDGAAAYQKELKSLSEQLGLKEKVLWPGAARGNMRAIYNAMDIATSSSKAEGFSNVIAEAMACGVPCVVSDVGDSAMIVNNPACVVPREDPAALSEAWAGVLNLTEEQRQQLRQNATRRIAEEFSVRSLVEKTETSLLNLLR